MIFPADTSERLAATMNGMFIFAVLLGLCQACNFGSSSDCDRLYESFLNSSSTRVDAVEAVGGRPDTDTGEPSSGDNYGAFPLNASPNGFNLNLSQAISEVCAWVSNPMYTFVCPQETAGNYTVGPENPALCVDGVDVTMSSSQFGNVSVSFGTEDLEGTNRNLSA